MRSALLAATILACNAPQPPAIHDAGIFGIRTPDAASPRPDAGARLLPHDGLILPELHVGIVYVGDADAGAAAAGDAVASIFASDYWALLDEYGIGAGVVSGGLCIATSVLLAPGDVDANGLVDVLVLRSRIADIVHGDAGPTIEGANAYLVFLPDGVNVALANRGSYVYRTCVDAYAYHSYDGFEPFAVFPPCNEGRSPYAMSHELAEMATDPQPFRGWVSDWDRPVNGGEVASICNEEIDYAGLPLARLWSNRAAECVP